MIHIVGMEKWKICAPIHWRTLFSASCAIPPAAGIPPAAPAFHSSRSSALSHEWSSCSPRLSKGSADQLERLRPASLKEVDIIQVVAWTSRMKVSSIYVSSCRSSVSSWKRVPPVGTSHGERIRRSSLDKLYSGSLPRYFHGCSHSPDSCGGFAQTKPGKLGHFSLPLEVALLRPLPLFFTQAQPTGRPGHSQLSDGWFCSMESASAQNFINNPAGWAPAAPLQTA